MPRNDRLRTEQEHHKKAFEVYYAMGAKRNYRQVAQELDVSPRTVKLWARSFGWKERVAERETATARRVADRTLQSSVSGLERNHKIVEMAIVRLAKAIADGKVRMQLGDLERLIRLQEIVDRHKDMNRIPQTPEELAAHIEYIFDNISLDLKRGTIEALRIRAGQAKQDTDTPPGHGQMKGK